MKRLFFFAVVCLAARSVAAQAEFDPPVQPLIDAARQTSHRLSSTVQHGTIIKLVPDRRFGFITSDHGIDYFFRYEDVVSDVESLRGDLLVRFQVAPSPKGPRAVNIAPEAGPADTAAAAKPDPAWRYGSITKLVPDRRFGFITSDHGMDYFFRYEDVVSDVESLRGDRLVRFQVAPSPKGPRAVHVIPL